MITPAAGPASQKGWITVGFDPAVWIPCPPVFPAGDDRRSWAQDMPGTGGTSPAFRAAVMTLLPSPAAWLRSMRSSTRRCRATLR